MIELTPEELKILDKIRELKVNSGTHSPSLYSMSDRIPEIKPEIDACFLSNPYATELFLNRFKTEMLDTNNIRDLLEFYPSQNKEIAKSISKYLEIESSNVFIGNGAIEIIQAILHNFVRDKIVVNIPTFSSYYEFVTNGTEVVFYKLNKDDNFVLDVEKYIRFVEEIKPNTIVIINPNNPDGGYINIDSIRQIVESLSWVENIIIDESFIHFASEDIENSLVSYTDIFKSNKNVILVKSMSKDFGIAGIRAGYAIMSQVKVQYLLSKGYLWNSNGLAEYFFRLYRNREFLNEYEKTRKKYITNAKIFFDQIAKIKQLKVYPSKANFALVELKDGTSASNFTSKLLIKHKIYVRNADDKIGLDGNFIRIASRTVEENEKIITAIKAIFEDE